MAGGTMAPMTLSKGTLAALLLLASSSLDGSNAFQPCSLTAGGGGGFAIGLSAPKFGRRAAPPSVVPAPSSAAVVARSRPLQNGVIIPAQVTSTALGGKLWDKLGIEADAPDEYHWYVINCIAGMELQLLQQVKRAAAEMPPRHKKYVKKLAVPTQRSLRSHGPKNVVDVKALYPGYVFCLIRLCPETYEPLQRCPLTRSWMGTVHMKGMRKLPVIPVSLNDDEVEKFKLLDEATDEMHAKFGKGYDGSGDSGKDLLDQYAGYEVDGMVKVLGGKHGGEDGVVKRLKDGKIKVRLFTYGQSFDEWYDPTEIRPMTDAEVLKGFTGPDGPVTQQDYEESIGRRPKDYGRRGAVDEGGGRRGSLRNQLMGSMSGGKRDRRMTRRDRQARGERGGQRDMFGRTKEEAEQEDRQWKEYREQQKAEESTQGAWGLKGDKPWMYEDTQDISGQSDDVTEQEDDRRRMRRSRDDTRFGGDRDWQSAGPSRGRAVDRSRGDSSGGWDDSGTKDDSSGDDDDFFAALMDDLSDTLDSASSGDAAAPSRGGGGGGGDAGDNRSRRNAARTQRQEEDDFFASLMSDLGEDDEPAAAQQPSRKASPADKSSAAGGDDDDFFAALEADLSDTFDAPSPSLASSSSTSTGSDDDDDFFASLESDLSGALDAPLPSSRSQKPPSKAAPADDDDFFAALEEEMSRDLDSAPGTASSGGGAATEQEDDFFAALEAEMGESGGGEEEAAEETPAAMSSGGGAASSFGDDDAEDDFFAALESDLSAELDSSPPPAPAAAAAAPAPAPAPAKKEAAPAVASSSGGRGGGGGEENLSKLTVPALKDMLRERGLKVSGKKAELIERLQEA